MKRNNNNVPITEIEPAMFEAIAHNLAHPQPNVEHGLNVASTQPIMIVKQITSKSKLPLHIYPK
jgi:hypothetical protein